MNWDELQRGYRFQAGTGKGFAKKMRKKLYPKASRPSPAPEPAPERQRAPFVTPPPASTPKLQQAEVKR